MNRLILERIMPIAEHEKEDAALEVRGFKARLETEMEKLYDLLLMYESLIKHQDEQSGNIDLLMSQYREKTREQVKRQIETQQLVVQQARNRYHASQERLLGKVVEEKKYVTLHEKVSMQEMTVAKLTEQQMMDELAVIHHGKGK
ncbi:MULTISPECIES: flagellar FliJ family protein [Exiguobacterium]|uniref:flagellar FliJ family protein n=1 Tax=Exiguobacterium TaxID=33986 RepID=UPI0004DF0A1E|nr:MULTISPECIES: flagellar FliJ family protein [Exiguobacterium]MBR2077187.1 flagellar FliJ family protein [Exiguobacterium sp.]MCC9623612.1 flagellar FliJ family protein [Thalassospira sp. MA62]MBR3216889.1 flagellar FliJ family protein [Exiguobacterium sp.]MCM3279365.1 flagellar FliJ family protein [Exiguobacterium sp. MER 193]MDX5981746.1 flagellar FliJ family protein [Exiguobacterium profundum]